MVVEKGRRKEGRKAGLVDGWMVCYLSMCILKVYFN